LSIFKEKLILLFQAAVIGRSRDTLCIRVIHREKYAAATSAAPGRRACARRAGANKSLSNCSLKNPVAPSRDGARQRPAALKPGFDILYFAQLVNRLSQPERADRARARWFVY